MEIGSGVRGWALLLSTRILNVITSLRSSPLLGGLSKYVNVTPRQPALKKPTTAPSINNLASLKDVNETEVAGLLSSRSSTNGHPLT